MKNFTEQHLFFSRSDVEITNTTLGLKINLKTCKSINEPGKPDFPGKIIRVALPEHTRALKVTEEVVRSSKITQEFQMVTSTQELGFVYLDENNEAVSSENEYHLPDNDAYENALKTEKPIVELITTEWVDNIPMAIFKVVPIRYLINGTIDLAEIIKVTIQLEEYKHKSPVPYKIRKKRFRDQDKVHRLIANPHFIEKMAFAPKAPDMPEFAMAPASLSIPDDVDYLIVTDNKKWNSETIAAGGNAGDMVSEFQRLADWKKQRGLRTHIARIQDIVDGEYGNFTQGARDLQEVIRDFLKSFCASKGVEWILIGGDISVVPVRHACASKYGRIYKGKATDAASGSTDGVLSGGNTIAWKTNFLAMLVKLDRYDVPIFGRNGNVLTNYRTGEIIPYDAAGTSNATTLGWYHTTDDTFATKTSTRTKWIRVNGPKNKINETLVWYTSDNIIATDLYYSSLYSPFYFAGKKDWDHLNNGLYGQHNEYNLQLDGADFVADIGLGRAPVESQAEAKVFVDKILEYEKWDEDPDTTSVERFKKMLYVSANWGDYFRIKPQDGNSSPPDNYKYYTNPTAGYSLLNTKKLPPEMGSKLICHITDTNQQVLSYSHDASSSHPGWYYAKSDTDLSASYKKIIFFKIPVPTKWIMVFGANSSQLTPFYYALDKAGQDSAMTEQETLRKWMKSNFYRINQVKRLYTDETDLSPIEYSDGSIKHQTADNLREELNAGPHFVSISGHGNPGGVAYLNTALVNSTTNGNKTSIIIADSCSTNRFDDEDSIGENTLKHAGGGAVAYIGNSRYSWIGVGDDFRLEFFKRMITSRHLGDLNDSRCKFAHDGSITKVWVILAQNLNGDPEMPVFRDYKDAIPRFVGNSRTMELHRSTCQWVGKMSYVNKVYFDNVNAGLNAGHDGCYYCLKQYHTH